MANNTQAFPHILQRIIPFESESFFSRELQLHPGKPVVLSGYFQLLHLGPFKALDESRIELNVGIAGSGTVLLRVKRLSESGVLGTLAEKKIALASTESFSFEISTTSLSGVAYLELESVEPNSIVREAYWAITRAQTQVRLPQLAIASCTFNRQKEIVRTIHAIQSSETFSQGRIELIVIDNGSNLELPFELRNDRLRVISQKNLGGAGGFTRGIIEAFGLSEVTHVLLMDDDVEIAPETIDRLSRWLAILPNNVSVSGAMLDAFQRTVLYEAGARFISHSFEVKPDFKNIELADTRKALVELATSSAADYGAWWFFAFSREALEAAGLPLPIFIRGDDIEFGVRLKSLGFKTLVIHGLAVWHEPFYLKRSVWPMYYAVRNFTLINGIHFKTPASTYVPAVAKMFIQFLLRYDYGAAAAIECGLSDFLKGPNFLLEPGDQTHVTVTKYLAAYQCENLSKVEADALRTKSRSEGPVKDRALRILTVNGHILPSTNHTPQILDHEYVSWRWLNRDAYVQVNSTTGAGQLFRKDSKKFWELLSKMMKTLVRAVLTFDKQCASFRTEFPKLTGEPSWRNYLGMPPISPNK